MNEILKTRLEKLLHDKDITYRELAHEIGVTELKLFLIRQGRNPDLELMVKLAKVLDVSIDYLVGLIDVDKVNDANKIIERFEEIEEIYRKSGSCEGYYTLCDVIAVVKERIEQNNLDKKIEKADLGMDEEDLRISGER